jgi:hypothetical protein
MGKKALAMPSRFIINGMPTMFPTCGSKKNIYKFWLKTLLTYIEDDDEVISKKHIVSKTHYSSKQSDDNKTECKGLEDMIFKLPKQYYDNRETWIKMGMILKGSGEYFDLWDRWSKQSHKYREGEMKKMWESFKTDGRIGLGTLIHWCNENGIVNALREKRSLKENVMSYPETPIKMDDSPKLVINQPKLDPMCTCPI